MANFPQSSRDEAFTLIELLIVVAIVSILAVSALVLFPHYVHKAKTAEADIALAEVKRLEAEFFSRTGTYSSDLNQIGFHPIPSLKYHTVFVQVEKSAAGWSYMVLLMPHEGSTTGGGYYSQGADGKVMSSMPGQGGAAGPGGGCAVWSGWGSMEGGKIEGEETLASSSNGSPPCGGGRTVQHGNRPTSAVGGK